MRGGIYKLLDLFICFKTVFSFFKFFTVIFIYDERDKKYMVKNRRKIKDSYYHIVLIMLFFKIKDNFCLKIELNQKEILLI